jgi:hypothetical protein
MIKVFILHKLNLKFRFFIDRKILKDYLEYTIYRRMG